MFTFLVLLSARVRLTFRAQIAILFAEFVGLILHVKLCRFLATRFFISTASRYVTKIDVNEKETHGLN